MASPIPLLPPVTTAVDPAKPRSIDVSLGQFVCANLLDHFGRHAQPTQAETHDAFAEIVAVAIAGRPLPLDARPHHAVDGLRVGYRIDVVKHLRCRPRCSASTERLEHLRVRGLNRLGRGEHLRLRLQRQSPQIRSDVVVERQVEPSVDPRRHRVDLRCGSCHSALQPPSSRRVPSPERPRTPVRPSSRNAGRTRGCSSWRAPAPRRRSSPRTPCSRNVVDAAARISLRTSGSGLSLSRRRVRGALAASRGCIVGGEVVGEPLANTLGGQAVVGQVVIVCAA